MPFLTLTAMPLILVVQFCHRQASHTSNKEKQNDIRGHIPIAKLCGHYTLTAKGDEILYANEGDTINSIQEMLCSLLMLR